MIILVFEKNCPEIKKASYHILASLDLLVPTSYQERFQVVVFESCSCYWCLVSSELGLRRQGPRLLRQWPLPGCARDSPRGWQTSALPGPAAFYRTFQNSGLPEVAMSSCQRPTGSQASASSRF